MTTSRWRPAVLLLPVLVVAVALPLALPVFRFPPPGGPHAIGTLTYHWTDASRPEVFGNNPRAPRQLMAQVWYPATPPTSSARAPYIRDADPVTTSLAQLHHLPALALHQLARVVSNAVEAAPVATQSTAYPVIVSLEGLTGYRQMNTFQIEELVSHGYIVVGLDQPGAASVVVFPDGHVIQGLSKPQMDPLLQQSIQASTPAPSWNGQTFEDGIIPFFAQDVPFALDQLAVLNQSDPHDLLSGRFDLQHIGLTGLSFGGLVGGEACLMEPRLKACFLMDVAMTSRVAARGLQQPTLWLTRDAATMRHERESAGGWTEHDIEQTQSTMRAAYQRLAGQGYFVQVPGLFHIDLTDINLVSPLFPLVGFSGPITAARAHDVINAYSVAFFDKHLKGMDVALLQRDHLPPPPAVFESRQP